MTWMQYLRHLWYWLVHEFPSKDEGEHFWIGIMGEPPWDCPMCGAVHPERDEPAGTWAETTMERIKEGGDDDDTVERDQEASEK